MNGDEMKAAAQKYGHTVSAPSFYYPANMHADVQKIPGAAPEVIHSGLCYTDNKALSRDILPEVTGLGRSRLQRLRDRYLR